MKKTLLLLLLSMLTSSPAFGAVLVEAKGGYFFFSSHKLQRIYNKGGADLQLTVSNSFRGPFQLYEGVEYLCREGTSLGGHQKTQFRALAVNLGVRTLLKISDRIDYDFTLGSRSLFVSVTNHSHFVDRHKHKSGVGGFAHMGLLFHLSSRCLLDLFGEYSYKRMHFHSSKTNVIGHDVQVGGYTFGGGLGYAF